MTMYSCTTRELKVEKSTGANKTEMTLDSNSSGLFLIVHSGEATTRDFFDLRHDRNLICTFHKSLDRSKDICDLRGPYHPSRSLEAKLTTSACCGESAITIFHSLHIGSFQVVSE